MPVTDPNMPEPLKVAMEAMETSVQATKSNLAYCAPEMMDTFWIGLQHELADSMRELYNDASGESYGEG